MAEGTSNIPELEAQKNEISQILRKLLVRQDNWCLIDNNWFKQWKKYVGYDNWETSNVRDKATHPGPIDNSPLLHDDGSGEIKKNLIDELDYVLVPEEAWEKLVEWYGIVEGQQPIVRKVVEYGMFVKHCKVEVNLLEFKLCSNNNLQHIVLKKFSKSDTIGYIEMEMRALFNILEGKETRLWSRYSHNTYEHLRNKDSTVQDAGLYSGQVLIIEEQNDDGKWPGQAKNSVDKDNSIVKATSTKKENGKDNLYSLIINQLFFDGHNSAAKALTDLVGTNIPAPSNRLSYLVTLGRSAETVFSDEETAEMQREMDEAAKWKSDMDEMLKKLEKKVEELYEDDKVDYEVDEDDAEKRRHNKKELRN